MKTRLLAALAVLLALTGCIDTTTTISVKPDGSGTIEKTIVLSRHLAELMISMGTKGDAASIEQGMLNESTLKAAAARMGSGVTFVSARKTSSDKGNGWEAVYSFKDITAVRLNQNPASDLTMPGAAAAANAIANSVKDSFSFGFTKGSPAMLTIAFPKPDQTAKPAGGPPAGAASNEKMVQTMRQLYADMRIVLAVQVDGTITKTNAHWVSGATVTILDMDFAKIMSDDATFKKLTSSQGQSMEEVRATVKSLPGIRIESQDPVSISFR
jgi:hypothetical protein